MKALIFSLVLFASSNVNSQVVDQWYNPVSADTNLFFKNFSDFEKCNEFIYMMLDEYSVEFDSYKFKDVENYTWFLPAIDENIKKEINIEMSYIVFDDFCRISMNYVY